MLGGQDGLFTDGGIRGCNPSPLGGSWCWVLVAGGLPVREASGFVTPADVGLPTVTNNVTELLAAIRALEAAPDGWSGTLYTDSKITLYRVDQRRKGQKPARMAGVPAWMRDALQTAKSRLGAYRVSLLGGHPTAHELNRGCREDGLPVSMWNVHCDRVCRRLAEEGLSKSTVPAGG
jgi:ribonuclease HI